MIVGAHTVISTKDAEADREFFERVFTLPSVDVGGGWSIFGLPPSEAAFHPSKRNNHHELYLLCDDVKKFVAEMRRMDVTCGRISRQRWGIVTSITLPGGGKLSVYEPLHERPRAPRRAQPRQSRPPRTVRARTRTRTP